MIFDISNLSWPSIVITGVITWFIYLQFIRRFLTPLRKLPGPETWSLTGNLGEIIREPPVDPYIKWANKYGGILRYSRLFGKYRVAAIDPDAIKHILVTHSSRYSKPKGFITTLRPLLGNGLFTAGDKDHSQQRKLINPAFKYAKLKGMVSVFESYTKEFIQFWQYKLEETKNSQTYTEVQAQDDLTRLTLDIICRCAFGYECNAVLNPDDEITKSLQSMFSGSDLSWKDLLPLYSYLPTKAKKRRQQALTTIKNKVNEVIDIKMSQNTNADSDSSLLDILLSLRDQKTGQGLTKEGLYDQVVTFMFAGHETTSVCLSWTLYVLAQHQEIQSKVRDEARKVLKEHNYQLTWDTLDEFVYLNKVLKESLRLYSPAPLSARECVQDDEIKGYVIPKGTVVMIVTPHRWEKYYGDPLEFKPDRWDAIEADDKNSNYTYIPFFIGPRNCIGSKFALSEMKCVLALLLDSFVFDVVPNIEVKRRLRITMKPNPNLKLRISVAK
ncbi:uncharacterized protein TRIADDRAFT_53196 [Trichoplax adhaerens]|uniref:Cytochrome P450 n=1 Tax=Trichoplax adhaerens TaxID=10228 RepID=B3RNK3_TRIAD|nr:hypothetical protein TRIADDRAFT_53196 [Trichoplax adhaerens]EDV27469.1 hypothetical protein TRIADDRAFT_53196 [Trichoplax adhaerens]|eukprot:XP_002109303.1 hypothetical protein TRIADDRAFT_53196 [Trichoplax adhaerens]